MTVQEFLDRVLPQFTAAEISCTAVKSTAASRCGRAGIP
jgi:hypothetical protein